MRAHLGGSQNGPDRHRPLHAAPERGWVTSNHNWHEGSIEMRPSRGKSRVDLDQKHTGVKCQQCKEPGRDPGTHDRRSRNGSARSAGTDGRGNPKPHWDGLVNRDLRSHPGALRVAFRADVAWTMLAREESNRQSSGVRRTRWRPTTSRVNCGIQARLSSIQRHVWRSWNEWRPVVRKRSDQLPDQTYASASI